MALGSATRARAALRIVGGADVSWFLLMLCPSRAWCQRSEGHGDAAHVRWPYPFRPLAPERSSHKLHSRMTEGRAEAKTILLIEDRREVLDVLGRTLSSNGFSVLTAM